MCNDVTINERTKFSIARNKSDRSTIPTSEDDKFSLPANYFVG